MKSTILMIRSVLSAGLLLALAGNVMGQASMPAPQSISGGYTQDFSSLTWSNTSVYPAGFQGWTNVASSPSGDPRSNAPSGNIGLGQKGSAASTTPAVYDFDGKIGIYPGSFNDINLCLAINTESEPLPKRIQITFDAMVIKNKYDGTVNTNQTSMVLQYRIGTSDLFTNVDNIIKNGTVQQTSGTSGIGTKTVTYVLPEECSGQPVVQLRWIGRYVSGNQPGSPDRPAFAIDNIQISGITITTPPFSGYVITSKNITDMSGNTYATKVLSGVTRIEARSPYLGSLADYKGNPKGYFTTYKDPVTSTWSLLDPDGYLFYSIGVNAISRGGGVDPVNSIKSVYANTIGNFSDENYDKMPYTSRTNWALNYKNTTTRTRGLYDASILPVFDADFETFCYTKASEIDPRYFTDKKLIGYFSDNEVPLANASSGASLIARWLDVNNYGGQAAADADINYTTARDWIKQRHGGVLVTPDADDVKEWPGVVAGKYFQVCRDAFQSVDPNHLYLGSRLHQDLLNPFLFQAAGQYCDVVSVNNYNVWEEADIKQRLDVWANNALKPVMITEFYAQAQDSGLPNVTGAGYKVYTQQDRADFFENYAMSVLKHKSTVGFHYFQYKDDPTSTTDATKGNNKGLLNVDYGWWQPMQQSFTEIGQDVYRLRDYLITGVQVLPVSFNGFTARAEGQAVRLDWGTISERNNDFFEVQHSADGKLFTSIGRVNGKGTTNLSSDYQLFHRSPVSGFNYYKLLQHDKNGSVTELGIKMVNFSLDRTSTLSVYPNPFKGQLTIQLKDHQGPDAEVSLTDLTGRVVYRETLTINGSQLQLNVKDKLPAGQYILSVVCKPDQKVSTNVILMD